MFARGVVHPSRLASTSTHETMFRIGSNFMSKWDFRGRQSILGGRRLLINQEKAISNAYERGYVRIKFVRPVATILNRASPNSTKTQIPICSNTYSTPSSGTPLVSR